MSERFLARSYMENELDRRFRSLLEFFLPGQIVPISIGKFKVGRHMITTIHVGTAVMLIPTL